MPGDGLPMMWNANYLCGAYYSVQDIPTKLRGSRARWVVHPEQSETGPCPECQEYAGQFLSVEEAIGLQPLHPNCKCSVNLDPAQPGTGEPLEDFLDYSLQSRNPELWNAGVRKKREAFAGGHDHTHRH